MLETGRFRGAHYRFSILCLLLVLAVLLVGTSAWATTTVTNLKVNTNGGDPVTVCTGNSMYIEYTANAPDAADVVWSVQAVIWDSGGGYVKSTCDVFNVSLEGPGHGRYENVCLSAPTTPGTYTLELIPYSENDCTSGDAGTSASCTLIVEAGETTTDASGSAGTILSGQSFTITAQMGSCVSNPCLIGSHVEDSCSSPRQLIGTVKFRDVTAGVDLGTQSIWESTLPYGDETVQLVTTGLLKHPTESIHTIAVTYEPSGSTPWHDDSSDTFQVTVLSDTESPQITCPGAITADTDAGACTASVSFEATATDNVSATVSYHISGTPITSPHDFPMDETTVTAVAIDPSGNESSCTFTVTVSDAEAPVINCPADTSGECDSGCDPADTGQATATDNCGSPTITYVDDFTPSGCGNTGTIERTWTATDGAGNTDSCVQTITVVDNIGPVITCPEDRTLEVGQSTMPVNTGTATAVDGCGTADVEWTDSFVFTGCGSARTITRTWTATDECGNSSECDQIINMVDTTAPSITCPADVSVQCLADVPAANPASVSTSDDNDPSPVVTHEGDDTLQTGLGSYVITRTYRSTDCADNWTECTQTITVDDTIAPVITLNGNSPMSVECGSSYNEPGAAVFDNCCIDAGDLVIDSSAVNTSVVGSYSVTYDIEDCAGNAAQQQVRTVLVVDSIPPAITLLGDNPVSILEGGTYTEAGATVNDACPGCVDAGDLVIDSSAVDTSTPGTYAVTYDIVDCHGNAGHEERTVQVLDITPPTVEIRTPADLAVYLLHEIVLADWSVSGVEGGIVHATAPDGAPIDTSSGGTHVFSVTAIDASGNTASASVTYSVQYRLLIDPTTGVMEFVVVADGEEDAPPPDEFLTVAYGLPIHIGCALLDQAGVPVQNLQLALTIVRVLPSEDSESYEILHLISVGYVEESGCYTQTLCEESGLMLEPGLYDLWLGLGDGRSLRQRVWVDAE